MINPDRTFDKPSAVKCGGLARLPGTPRARKTLFSTSKLSAGHLVYAVDDVSYMPMGSLLVFRQDDQPPLVP